ncbi:hypothetical protein EYF80_013557 [Liparis tanakae]|uniref:Uncharacterized protein n=1 Tax=Liparis tanakae TaxID=230148 RepID=A0A4Z2IDV9_9TELE|nr:hypothetical protein EYF80_013557 [Liparis tanakae]
MSFCGSGASITHTHASQSHFAAGHNSFHFSSALESGMSLLFFFRHFHGLKILPMVENLPLRFGGGVLPPSPTMVPWCCSASSSKI